MIKTSSFKDEFIKIAAAKIPFFSTKAGKDFLAGALAGTITTAALAPLDAVKDTMRAGGEGSDKSFIRTAKNLYGEGGIGRFYQGMGAGAIKSALGMGLSFALAKKLGQAFK